MSHRTVCSFIKQKYQQNKKNESIWLHVRGECFTFSSPFSRYMIEFSSVKASVALAQGFPAYMRTPEPASCPDTSQPMVFQRRQHRSTAGAPRPIASRAHLLSLTVWSVRRQDIQQIHLNYDPRAEIISLLFIG